MKGNKVKGILGMGLLGNRYLKFYYENGETRDYYFEKDFFEKEVENNNDNDEENV
jgi:hypothetical protein